MSLPVSKSRFSWQQKSRPINLDGYGVLGATTVPTLALSRSGCRGRQRSGCPLSLASQAPPGQFCYFRVAANIYTLATRCQVIADWSSTEIRVSSVLGAPADGPGKPVTSRPTPQLRIPEKLQRNSGSGQTLPPTRPAQRLFLTFGLSFGIPGW